MGSDADFMTTTEAALYLGTSRQVIYWYVKNKRLKRATKEMGANGRTQYLFRAQDVELLLKQKQEKKQKGGQLTEALVRATRAEAMCREQERRLDDLYEALGLRYEAPDLSDDGLRAQHRNAHDLLHDEVPIAPNEALDLARRVYRMDEEQLRLLELCLSDPEPWGVYMGAVKKAASEMRDNGSEEARHAERYLGIAARHLRHVAFEFVRTAYGHVKAEQMAEESGDAVDDDIARILMSTARID